MSDAAHPELVARPTIVDIILRAPGAFYLLAILALGLTLWTPGFFTTANLTNVALQVAVLSIVALGMTLVILTEGIDLSLGPVLGLCGVRPPCCLPPAIRCRSRLLQRWRLACALGFSTGPWLPLLRCLLSL